MIQLVGIGAAPLEDLDLLAARLARQLRISCRVLTGNIDPEFAWDPVRGQYHATALVRRLASMAAAEDPGSRLLGVADVDLYVPIFTFVYGEAQLGGPAAVISKFRLRQEFYGLAGDSALTAERLAKEALHEVGHTYQLRHCQDWSCPMAASTSIERLDWKGSWYCPDCAREIRSRE